MNCSGEEVVLEKSLIQNKDMYIVHCKWNTSFKIQINLLIDESFYFKQTIRAAEDLHRDISLGH